jgi:hypothetical protein
MIGTLKVFLLLNMVLLDPGTPPKAYQIETYAEASSMEQCRAMKFIAENYVVRFKGSTKTVVTVDAECVQSEMAPELNLPDGGGT